MTSVFSDSTGSVFLLNAAHALRHLVDERGEVVDVTSAQNHSSTRIRLVEGLQ